MADIKYVKPNWYHNHPFVHAQKSFFLLGASLYYIAYHIQEKYKYITTLMYINVNIMCGLWIWNQFMWIKQGPSLSPWSW